jgi:hypothetical protein
MAVSRSVTYLAPSPSVWRALVRLVQDAGYEVVETNQGAKTIAYHASGGLFAWKQKVRISLAEVGEKETVLSIYVDAAKTANLGQGARQRKLADFILGELDTVFERGQERAPRKAPGAGCLSAVVFGVGVALSGLC